MTLYNLIKKDFIALVNYKRLIYISIILAIFFAFLGFYDSTLNDITYVGIVLPVTLIGGLASTVISEEEKALSDSYILTMPVTKVSIIKAKFLYSYSLILTGLIISFLIYLITSLFFNIKLMEVLTMSISFSLLTNVFFIIRTPLIYKYGTEKTNTIIMLFFFALLALAPVLLIFINSIDHDFENTVNILSYLMDYIYLIVIILTIFCNYLSYVISKKIYLKKEF